MEVNLKECLDQFEKTYATWLYCTLFNNEYKTPKEALLSIIDNERLGTALGSSDMSFFESALLYVCYRCVGYLQSFSYNEELGRVCPSDVIIGKIIDVVLKKNADYGCSVYTQPELAPSVDVPTAMLVRLSDKFKRVRNLLSGKKEEVEDESVKDTVRDIIGYSMLLWCWRYTESQQKESV